MELFGEYDASFGGPKRQRGPIRALRLAGTFFPAKLIHFYINLD
jgi:hypothetical protein